MDRINFDGFGKAPTVLIRRSQLTRTITLNRSKIITNGSFKFFDYSGFRNGSYNGHRATATPGVTHCGNTTHDQLVRFRNFCGESADFIEPVDISIKIFIDHFRPGDTDVRCFNIFLFSIICHFQSFNLNIECSKLPIDEKGHEGGHSNRDCSDHVFSIGTFNDFHAFSRIQKVEQPVRPCFIGDQEPH